MTFRMASIPTPQSKEYLAFVEEEQRKTDEAVRRAAVVPTALAREVALADLEFSSIWQLPIPTLQKAFSSPEKRPSLYWNVSLRLEGTPRTDQRSEDAQAEFARFVDSLPARTGYRLGVGGVKRFELFVCSQLSAGIEATAETLSLAFNKLVEGECFQGTELAYDEGLKAAPEPSAKPRASAASFEQLDISGNSEHQSIARSIAQRLFDEAFAPIVAKWAGSIYDRFGFTMDETIANAIRNFFERRNMPRTVESLEAARRMLVKEGLMPESCLDLEDLRAICIEKLPSEDHEAIRIALRGNLLAVRALMARKGISAV